MNCNNCEFNYFCCTFLVKLTSEEKKIIENAGYDDFSEEDGVIKLIKGKCFFLKDNQCQIYSIRPKICQDFPFKEGCKKIYYNWQKHQDKINKMLK